MNTYRSYSSLLFNLCHIILKIVKIAKPVVDLGRDTMLGKPFVITLDAKNVKLYHKIGKDSL